MKQLVRSLTTVGEKPAMVSKILNGLLALCLLLATTTSARAGGGAPAPTKQMRSWLFTSTLVNFSSGTAAASTQFAGTSGFGAKQVSGAAFDASNQLLFYVGHDAFNGPGGSYAANTVFSASNQAVGQLNTLVKSGKSPGETDWIFRGKETVIAPVPGVCSQYYVFFTLSTNYNTILVYAIINCASGTPVIAQNTQRVDYNVLYAGVLPAWPCPSCKLMVPVGST